MIQMTIEEIVQMVIKKRKKLLARLATENYAKKLRAVKIHT